MDITIFLAKFWGWLLILLCGVFLVRKKLLEDELDRLSKDKTFTIITGWIALMIGLATIILHNVWVWDWRVIITIFGWLSLIKGLLRIDVEAPKKIVPKVKKNLLLIRALLIIIILLGAYLVWVS